MYPYHHHGHWHHFHRGPRRFFWFLIGAGVATFWIKSKEENRERAMGMGWWGHCHRQAIQAAPAPVQSYEQSPAHASARPWGWRPDERWANGAHPAPRAVASDSAQSPIAEGGMRSQQETGKQAGDKLVELSEATLDTVLTTVEVLKAKLAEHRAEREKTRAGDKNDTTPKIV